MKPHPLDVCQGLAENSEDNKLARGILFGLAISIPLDALLIWGLVSFFAWWWN